MKDVLSEIKMSSVIPSNVQDFSEASIYCIEAMNDDYDTLMEEAGLLNESAEAEEAITEADASILKEKAVKFFQTMWAKVKEFFARVFNFFKDACEKATKAIKDKAAAMIKAGREKAADKIEKIVSSEVIDAALKSDATISWTVFETKNLRGVGDNNFPEMPKFTGQDINEMIDGLPGKFMTGAKSTSEMKELYKKAVKLESKNVKLSDLNKNAVDAAIDTVRKNSIGEDIKKAYNESRDIFKKAITDAKNYKNNTNDKAFKKNYQEKINYYRRYLQCLQTINASSMEILREKFAQDVRLIIKVYTVGKKELAKAEKAKEPEKPVKTESVFEW